MLARFNTIGEEEAEAARQAVLSGCLSGYLGGIDKGGPQVEALEREWCEAFGCKYAVAVNSATSGLLIACQAAGVGRGGEVVTSPYTMSATAAVAKFLGADVKFGDIEPQTYTLRPSLGILSARTRAVIITNLFGHPGELAWWRRTADTHKFCLIEDNAQAIGAHEYGRYTGTIGNVGVFSLNVHKHLQSGEGGICTTDDPLYAHILRIDRNHGELAGSLLPGLNLRMTEVTAAIARVQLKRRQEIISERIEIAESLSDMLRDIPGIDPPTVRQNCKHVFYVWAARCRQQPHRLAKYLNEKGMPVNVGYIDPLYNLPAFLSTALPTTEKAEASILTYENCAWTPTIRDIAKWHEALQRATDRVHADSRA